MRDPPRFAIAAIRAHERAVQLRLPFRFGNTTVTSAPQAFVEVRVRFADGREAVGAGAELMMPRWFDKANDKTVGRNVDDLRASVVAACDAYNSDPVPASAFGHAARHYPSLMTCGQLAGRTSLSSAFGGALVDRAVTDALCRACEISFPDALRSNRLGIDASLAADLAAFDIDAFLARCSLPKTVAVRHTIGLADLVDDGSLASIIARYGHRHFKVKLAGDVEADLARIEAIAQLLDRLPSFVVTLDGNEQFAGIERVTELIARINAAPDLRRFVACVRYLEQPLARDNLCSVAGDMPFLIDEGDDSYDAWPRARHAGYTGVSSKSCKGMYKSIVSAMRCRIWNDAAQASRYFLSGEDLTTQCGLAIQQDLALAATLGITHVERNGHHYVDGFKGQGAPAHERDAFVAAHSDLYAANGGNAHLVIRDGTVSLRSLDCTGYASRAKPDLDGMMPLAAPSEREIAHE